MSDAPSAERTRVVVVTGLSGAGKSTAIHALEDLGYFCVDNLPPQLLERNVELCEQGGVRRVGIGVDVRVGAFLDGAIVALAGVSAARDLQVLFLDASDETLIRRFSETRRPHPLTRNARETGTSAVALVEGVTLERERLAPLRANADIVIDTTTLSVHELRRQVVAHLGPGKGEAPRMLTRVVSFGFKFGLPVDADVVFDVRSLDNPYFVPALKRLPGTEPAVRDYVLGNPETVELLSRLEHLLEWSMPRYEREGKAYLTIAIGCTGGRHRSVVVTEELAKRLEKATGLPLSVFHRDVERGDKMGVAAGGTETGARLSEAPPRGEGMS